MSNNEISSWFPALIYTLEKKDKYSVLKLIIKIFIANLIFATTATLTLWLIFGTGEEAAFFKESELGGSAALYNLIIFLLIVIVSSLSIYLLIKLRKFNILEAIGIFLFSLVSGSISSIVIPLLTYITLYLLSSLFMIEYVLSVFLNIFDVFSIAMFILFFILQAIVLTQKRFSAIRNWLLLMTASWSGVFMGLYTGFLTPLVMMVGFSLYDIYAVKRGPIKKITQELCEMRPESSEDRSKSSFVLGLGDLFFYSMALSYSLAYFNAFVFFEVAFALILGVILTIWILISSPSVEKELPALPIPLMFALIVIFFNSII